MTDHFTEIYLADRVKVPPHHLGQEIVRHIATVIRERYEGRCSKYGYVLPGSTHITHVSAGQVETFSLHGSVVYRVSVRCNVCNPAPGCVLRCVVMNMNDFGVLAVWGYSDPDTAIFQPVVEVVVPVQSPVIQNDPEALRKLSIGQTVSVEVLGKKFTYADRKINAIGRIVPSGAEQRVVYDAAQVAGYTQASSGAARGDILLDVEDLYDSLSEAGGEDKADAPGDDESLAPSAESEDEDDGTVGVDDEGAADNGSEGSDSSSESSESGSDM